MDKATIRKHLLEIRRKISENEINEKSTLVFQKLSSMKEVQNANVVSCYLSFSDEVQTKDIINYLLHTKKTVCVPTIVDTKNRVMKAKEIIGINNDEYIFGNNISENLIDLCIVPGVGFDNYKNRIGFGKGYYDRFLRKCVNSFKIGICFNEQMVESLPVDEKDIKMNTIINY